MKFTLSFRCQQKTIIFFGVLCTCAYAYLAWLSNIDNGPSLTQFGLLTGLITLATGQLFLSLKKNTGIYIVIGFAVLFRLLGLYGEPIYEDDYFRYLWDGYRFAVDGTPYGPAPEAYFGDPNISENFQAILSGINHPDIPTIYAPTFQYLFWLAYKIAPGSLWPLTLCLIIFDIVVMLCLSRHLPTRHILLYAWNPLVIKEIAFTAHPDGVLGGLLLISWLLISQHRSNYAAIMLALATATKVAAWPVIPFLLIRCKKSAWLIFICVLIALYSPFFLNGGTDLLGLFAFARDFEFNSAVYAIVTWMTPPGWARPSLGIVYLIGLGLYFIHYLKLSRPYPPRIDIILGGLLLISPVINPWYLLWLLPWACLQPSLTAWVASIAVLLSYTTGLNLDDPTLTPYQHPIWVRPVEFSLIAIALGRDGWQWLKANKTA